MSITKEALMVPGTKRKMYSIWVRGACFRKDSDLFRLPQQNTSSQVQPPPSMCCGGGGGDDIPNDDELGMIGALADMIPDNGSDDEFDGVSIALS